MALYRFFPLSDWTQIFIIRRFHHACRFPARANWHFQLLTYHYIARVTLVCSVGSKTRTNFSNPSPLLASIHLLNKFDSDNVNNSNLKYALFSMRNEWQFFYPTCVCVEGNYPSSCIFDIPQRLYSGIHTTYQQDTYKDFCCLVQCKSRAKHSYF